MLAKIQFFYRKIVYGHEAHFWLDANVIKQNCQFQSEDQHCKSHQYIQKVTVWGGLWAGGIIAIYFLKDAANRNVTVNAEPYHEMIINFYWVKCTFGAGQLAVQAVQCDFFVGPC